MPNIEREQQVNIQKTITLTWDVIVPTDVTYILVVYIMYYMLITYTYCLNQDDP